MIWEITDQTTLGWIAWPPLLPEWDWMLTLLAGPMLLMVGAAWSDLLGGLSNKKQMRLAEVLKPYYDLHEIEQATQNYIPTRYLRLGPGQASHAPAAAQPDESRKLIPFLLERDLSEEVSQVLVMADSGIGKTTFMLNLYQTCAFDKKYQRPVELFPLRDPETMKLVAALPKREQLTLLLDGFNEDPQAITNYETRLQAIIEQTKGFGQVIITCRTRFFSNELSQPIEVYLQQADTEAHRAFVSFYLSTFSEEEVRRYIKKKYSVWNRNKRRRAMEIIDQAPHLMEQPLLLSFAEDLLDGQRSYRHTYEIYEDLITTWIARAAYPQPPERRERFQQSLYDLMLDLSMALYHKHHGGEGLFLSEGDVLALIERHNLRSEEIRADGRSLFNYYANQGYKFTHNSIMEYFLAQEAYHNPDFMREVSFAGLDQAQRFLLEQMITHDMAQVEGGYFLMGKADQQVRKQVDDFFMARTPVTMAQYQLFCEAKGHEWPGEPTWGFQADLPMVQVNWEDAQAYCRWLSSLTGHLFRLPTEKEWEYAARGGRKNRRHPYAGGKQLDQVAWYGKNSERHPHPVGQKQPNELGIYDLSGQVWEWCQDWYQLELGAIDRESVDASPGRTIRGGSWLNHESSCRVDMRGFSDPNNRSNIIGFRIIAEVPEI